MDLATAYRTCEDVTRHRARNFYYGIRLLPPVKRRALCSVYAFARRIDDIGDGSLPEHEKLRLLDSARSDLERLAHPERSGDLAADPVLSAVADARGRFGLPDGAFNDLVDGVELDVRGTTYERFEDLEVYCRRVAGSIGRLSSAVFGSADPDRASALSDDLGVAMQITNILRDVSEDRAAGRVYLPAEDLASFDWDPRDGAGGAGLDDLIRFEVARARWWFDRGLRLLPLLDRRSGACVSAMTGIYRRILARIDRRPEEVLRRRISLRPHEKAWVAITSLRPRARPAANGSAGRSQIGGAR